MVWLYLILQKVSDLSYFLILSIITCNKLYSNPGYTMKTYKDQRLDRPSNPLYSQRPMCALKNVQCLPILQL